MILSNKAKYSNLTWQQIYTITESLADSEWRVEMCWERGHNLGYPIQIDAFQEC